MKLKWLNALENCHHKYFIMQNVPKWEMCMCCVNVCSLISVPNLSVSDINSFIVKCVQNGNVLSRCMKELLPFRQKHPQTTKFSSIIWNWLRAMVKNSESWISQAKRRMIHHNNRWIYINQWHIGNDGILAWTKSTTVASSFFQLQEIQLWNFQSEFFRIIILIVAKWSG